MLESFRKRLTESATTSIAVSTSAAVLNRPNPKRRLLRTASSGSPNARSTWLGCGFADVHALPELTARRDCMSSSKASPST